MNLFHPNTNDGCNNNQSAGPIRRHPARLKVRKNIPTPQLTTNNEPKMETAIYSNDKAEKIDGDRDMLGCNEGKGDGGRGNDADERILRLLMESKRNKKWKHPH